jgi:hypothetical protein
MKRMIKLFGVRRAVTRHSQQYFQEFHVEGMEIEPGLRQGMHTINSDL